MDNALHNMNRSISVLIIGCVNIHPESHESTKKMDWDEKQGKLINKLVNPDNRRMFGQQDDMDMQRQMGGPRGLPMEMRMMMMMRPDMDSQE